ncbi:ABC transporter substrate-binding protein [Seohaeicola nanhaiensis]|uniref:ABC transporter substrate-binding protein n=1 Tax=Seohaeicola nanhaiensis TaxID=1387282 RepID=A0ABV9KPG1_9RHOB
MLRLGKTAFALALALPVPALAQDAQTLVIGRAMDVNSLDPARAFCDTCQFYLTAVYETLITLEPDNKTLKPNLAESWENNADFTEFTFHLKDATFADGSPVEASDVVWSFERLKNLKASPSFLMDGLVSAEATDAKTVVVKVDAPNSEFLFKVSAPYAGIVNADAAKEAGAIADETAAEKDQAEPWFLGASAGSGPYTLVKYTPEAELRLARNDGYWGEKPFFAEVVVSQIQDAVGQAQALESGQIDVAMQIDPDTASSMTNADVVTQVVPSFNFLYIALSPAAKGAEKLTPKVREALALAIDYDGMLDFTVGGNGVKQPAPIPNGFPGTAGLTPRSQDLEKAKAMLAEEGVTDLTLLAMYPNDNVYGVDINVMMQKVQQDFSAVGVKLDLQPQTYAVWRENLSGPDGIPVTAVYYAPDYYGSGQYVAYFGMYEGSPWENRAGKDTDKAVDPRIAPLYAKALAASGAEADAVYAEIGQAMMDENIIITLVSPNLVLAHRADITGVRYSACCNLPLAEIARK